MNSSIKKDPNVNIDTPVDISALSAPAPQRPPLSPNQAVAQARLLSLLQAKQQQSQQLRLQSFKLRKFTNVYFSYMFFLFFLIFLHVSGILFFTRGFLLSRPVLEDISSCEDFNQHLNTYDDDNNINNEGCWTEPTFKKAVIIVIDALRFDFTIPVNDSAPYHNSLKLPYELASSNPDQAILLKFLADPPTTTLQRLKGLTTGSLPTFIDAGSNFAGTIIEEDNFILQFFKQNKQVSFIGDDTWDALFNPYLHQNTSIPYESLNVWDLHTVDNGVIEHILPLLEHNKDWDLLIGHCLGLDHVGHRFGPDNPIIIEKLKQMDEFIKNVIDLLDNDTLLIVMGDHGMDPKGDHGGESKLELESSLFLYSKQSLKFNSLNKKNYNTENSGLNYRSINQIDLVPTISLLLGIPIPFNNLGLPIHEAFKNEKFLGIANFLTINQIQRYRKISNLKSENLLKKYNEIINFFKLLKKTNNDDENEWKKFNLLSKNYQKESLLQCRELWVKFDHISIYIGLIIIGISIILLILYSLSIETILLSQVSQDFLSSFPTSILFSIAFLGIIKLITNYSIWWCFLLSFTISLIYGFISSIPWDKIHFLSIKEINSVHLLSGLIIIIHFSLFASNSFTIWEDKIILFLLSTFGIWSIIKSIKLNNPIDQTLGIYHSILFIIIERLSSYSKICREEQLPYCKSTFYSSENSTISSFLTIFGMFLSSIILPKIIKTFYDYSSSYQAMAPIWIKTLRILMILSSIYWLLDYLDSKSFEKIDLNQLFNNNNNNEIKFPIIINLKDFNLDILKLILSRIILGISLIALNIVWYYSPTCLNLINGEIIGIKNIYGSNYLLLILNFFNLIFLMIKPMGSIILSLTLFQILIICEIFYILNLKNSFLSTIIFGLLSYSCFFKTGHQASLASIQWDTAFILTRTVQFPLAQIPVILNTFGPFILTTLSIVLLTLWNLKSVKKPIRLLSDILQNLLQIMLYQSIIGLSSFIFAFIFRRHLMVWKIFAPRYMVGGLILLTTDIVVFIGFFTSEILIRKVENLFR